MRSDARLGLRTSWRRSIVLLALLAILGVAAQAQSGRRLPNRSEPPPSQPSTAPTVPAEQPPPTKPDKPKQQLVVAKSTSNSFSNYYADVVVQSCLDRQGGSQRVGLSGKRDEPQGGQ